MSNQNSNEKQKSKSFYRQGSGSEYHKEHAGKVEGYGQPHSNISVSNNTKDNDQ
ncbi:hypothetical protein [Bacillus sp. 03113]|uniref:hypothetical protein n=1 Tax=Bacillus sp. 03113 TaxID=2578211 RepID=UPI0015E8BED0|nr:hypothetical protein [Bacillus sp. 03113]